MQQDYTAFINRVISRYEGGFGWNRNDPGGPTNFGITCYDLAEFYHEPMNSMAAWAPRVQAMSLAVADQIYATKYATACRFSDLNSGPDCVVLDFGINSGPSRAIIYAQQIVGVPVDGILGPVTLAAINKYDPAQFVVRLCASRMSFLRALGTWGTFGVGWTARVVDLRAYSLALINGYKLLRLGHSLYDYFIPPTPIPLAGAKSYSREDLAPL